MGSWDCGVHAGIVVAFFEIFSDGYESFASVTGRNNWLVLLHGDKFGR
jgi:hypothetical protein